VQPTSRHSRRSGPAMAQFALTLGFSLLSARAATAAPAVRIAVGVERSQEIAVPEQPGDHGAIRALAQGVREACVDPVTHHLRTAPVRCKTVSDVPATGVCVDETTEQALTTEIVCSPGDLTAEAIDLSRSGCETSDCYEVEARRAGATHLLVVTGAWQDGGFTVADRMTDLSNGSVHQFTPNDFANRYSPDWPRTGPQVLGLLKWLARAQTGEKIIAQAKEARAGGNGGASAQAIPPAPVPEAPAGAVQPPAAPTSRAWLGWSLVGVGVAAGVGSAIVWSMNGDPRDCDAGVAGDPNACRRLLQTKVPAAALGVAALGALVGGAVVLIEDRQGRGDVTLFLHPSSVALGGRF
jgi:hypothetical protein